MEGGREKEIAPTFAQFGETILGLPPITVVVQINKFIHIEPKHPYGIQVKHMENKPHMANKHPSQAHGKYMMIHSSYP